MLHSLCCVFYEDWQIYKMYPQFMVSNRIVCCCLFSSLMAKSSHLFYSPMDCSPPGSSDLGSPQARILEWVAISFFKGSPQPRIKPWILSPALAGRFLLWSHLGSHRIVSLPQKSPVLSTQAFLSSLNSWKLLIF